MLRLAGRLLILSAQAPSRDRARAKQEKVAGLNGHDFTVSSRGPQVWTLPARVERAADRDGPGRQKKKEEIS